MSCRLSWALSVHRLVDWSVHRLQQPRTISVVMADSGDPPPMACGESPESAMGVRSAELSACLKSFLSVCLKPLVDLPWPQLRKLPAHPAVHAVSHHDAHCKSTGGPSAEKRQKQSIPGLIGFELDGDTPLDVIMGPCQFPEMLAPYRNVGGEAYNFPYRLLVERTCHWKGPLVLQTTQTRLRLS